MVCRTRYKWLEGVDQREGRKEVIVVILFMDHFAFSIAWSLPLPDKQFVIFRDYTLHF